MSATEVLNLRHIGMMGEFAMALTLDEGRMKDMILLLLNRRMLYYQRESITSIDQYVPFVKANWK